MKRLIKIASLLMAVCVGLTCFSGCSKKVEDDFTTVVFWSDSGAAKGFMMDKFKEFNDTIGKEQKIYVDLVFKEGDMDQQVELAYQTGQAPDIYSSGELAKYVENGWVAALEDMPGGEEFVREYRDHGLLVENTHIYDGKTYRVPTGSQLFGLAYNKDMFKAAGIVDENGEPTPPKTLDEMREYAKRLTDKSKKQYGVIFPMKWSGFVEYELGSLLQSSYGRDEYDTITGTYDFSVFKEILGFAKQLRDDGSLYPGAESMDNDPARARFAEGNIGMKFAVSWDVGVLNDQFPAQCDWDIAPLPVVDQDNCYYQKEKVSVGMYINKQSLEHKDPEKVMCVYDWYYGKDLRRETYEQSLSLPVIPEYIEGAETKVKKAGWEGFAKVLEISRMSPTQINTDLGSDPTFSDLFKNEFWQDLSTADEIIEKANKIYNEGIARYKKNNPDYNSDACINPDWNVKR